MKQYLTDMGDALFMAVGPTTDPGKVIAALGPKMLEVAATQANGAHPYFTTPEHTDYSRTIMGKGPLLAPEQMVVLDTNPETARATARQAMMVYLRAPNYQNNLKRLGFTDDDWADPKNPPDRLVDAVVAWGSADQIKARVQEHLDAGADHVCVQALRPDSQLPIAEWTELASVLL
jgi:probable F420-dependent oxidoreductase